MKKTVLRPWFSFPILCLILADCSVPRKMFPSKDIPSFELHSSAMGKKILLSSSDSDFKSAVIGRIREAFKNDSVFVKAVGLGLLEREDPGLFSAFVLMNTCVAWRMDPHVDKFIRKHPDLQPRMIVLFTSGDGDWKPDLSKIRVDAVTSASKTERLDETAEKMIARLRSLLSVR
jgi:hypothetical protein